MIGDPSGRNATRPPLTREQIQENAKTYEKQVFKILDPAKTEILFNSELVERARRRGDDPARRALHRLAAPRSATTSPSASDAEQPIHLHELLYPLMQGYDSVAMKSDVELGGTDQKFNLLVGRELQKQFGQESQIIVTTPLLEGLDGVQKMSKSLGNYVGIDEPPQEMFGKLMSISDELMWRYLELLSFRPLSEIEGWRREVESGRNPRDVKVALARRSSSASTARRPRASGRWPSSRRASATAAMPEEIPAVIVAGGRRLRSSSPRCSSRPDSRRARPRRARMIDQGGVRLDGERVSDKGLKLARWNHRRGAGREAQVRPRDARVAFEAGPDGRAMSPADLARLVGLAAVWGLAFVFIRVAVPPLGPGRAHGRSGRWSRVRALPVAYAIGVANSAGGPVARFLDFRRAQLGYPVHADLRRRGGDDRGVRRDSGRHGAAVRRAHRGGVGGRAADGAEGRRAWAGVAGVALLVGWNLRAPRCRPRGRSPRRSARRRSSAWRRTTPDQDPRHPAARHRRGQPALPPARCSCRSSALSPPVAMPTALEWANALARVRLSPRSRSSFTSG